MILLDAILISMIVLKRINLGKQGKNGTLFSRYTPQSITHEWQVQDDDRKIRYDYVYRKKPTSYFWVISI
jgi:hypothetical protein